MKATNYRCKLLLILSFLIGIFVNNNLASQLVISNQGTTAQTLVNGIIGSGITISNPVITCPSSAYGLFSGGAGIGVSNGVVLTTGNASNLPNNGSTMMNTMIGTDCNDPQLTNLEPLASNDCCILEFDVLPSCNQLSIRFIFGSEEYPEYVGLGFNDAFGFFVTGPNPAGGTYINKNIAIVTGTTICSIDNVNSGVNSGFYVNNATGVGFVFDGYTTPLISTLNVTPCQTYHFKLAIADSGDDALDSGILIDVLGCSTLLSASTTTTPAGCGVNNGTATVTASNSIGALNYVWSPAPGGGQGTANATGLTGGTTYTVTVDDIYSCIPPVTNTVTVGSTSGGANVTNAPLTQTICSGTTTAPVVLTADVIGATFAWTATSTSGITGFTTSGTSTIPAQTILNSGATSGTVTYAVTPTAGGCDGPIVYYVVTINPQITPTFNVFSDICMNSVAPTLPINSTNTPSIAGTWSPAVNTTILGTTTYTFTPTASQCVGTATATFAVVSQVIPTFTPVAILCQGSIAQGLPSSSTNTPAISGTWIPATISTAILGITTYTFTSNPGQCGGIATMNITISTPITPTFAAITNVCQNSIVPSLPLSSTNIPAITGTWLPAVSTATLGTTLYTFTPSGSQCATTATNTITVVPQITPTFTAIPTICQNSTPAPILPTSSTNIPAITGTWSPSMINTTVAGATLYTFTPSAGQCASTTMLVDTIVSQIIPTFATIANVCINSVAPTLPTSSTNVPTITGTWSPTVNTTVAGTFTYTFTPTDETCATIATNTITVTSAVTPLFASINPICAGSVPPALSMNSINNPPIAGTWSPSIVSNVATTNYTYTPNVGECATGTSLTVTVNPLPVLTVVDPSPICEPLTVDLTDPSLTVGSSGGIISYYSNSACTIPVSSPTSVSSSGIYYIASVSSSGCVTSMPINVSVYPLPQANFTPVPELLNWFNLTSTMDNQTVGASNYEWYFMDGSASTEINPSHTFPDDLYGDQLIILIATSTDGCKDTTNKVITIVEELIYYIPNSFTPDGDKYNETFQAVFNSGYDPYDFKMLIFDRWGELVFESNDASIGWSGTLGEKGDLVQDGVYTWKIEFKLKGIDDRRVETGHVSILK